MNILMEFFMTFLIRYALILSLVFANTRSFALNDGSSSILGDKRTPISLGVAALGLAFLVKQFTGASTLASSQERYPVPKSAISASDLEGKPLMLVSGAGIAGLSVALMLKNMGHEVLVLE